MNVITFPFRTTYKKMFSEDTRTLLSSLIFVGHRPAAEDCSMTSDTCWATVLMTALYVSSGMVSTNLLKFLLKWTLINLDITKMRMWVYLSVCDLYSSNIRSSALPHFGVGLSTLSAPLFMPRMPYHAILRYMTFQRRKTDAVKHAGTRSPTTANRACGRTREPRSAPSKGAGDHIHTRWPLVSLDATARIVGTKIARSDPKSD